VNSYHITGDTKVEKATDGSSFFFSDEGNGKGTGSKREEADGQRKIL